MVDMKKKLFLGIKICCFCILLIGAFYLSCKVVQSKAADNRYAGFFEGAKDGTLDALIFGTSHVINGINPVQMYSETGITSFNMGAYGSPFSSIYWQMVLAFEEYEPKLVIVDSYMLEYDVRYQDDPNANATLEMQHNVLDAYPLSVMKLRACNDMFESNKTKLEFAFPFILYHDRWKELEKNDYLTLVGKGDDNKLKGADILYTLHADQYNYYANPDYNQLETETIGTQYFRRIILECQKRGIQVVAMSIPYNAQELGQRANGTARKICEEYGVPYCDMLGVEGLIDVNIDLSDSGHLNALGMKKATSYLGNWLINNNVTATAGMDDHRDDEEYSSWDSLAQKSEKKTRDEVLFQTDLYSQLMLMSMSDEDFIIKINGSTEVYSDNTLLSLIRGINPDTEVLQAKESNQPFFLIKNNGVIEEFVGYGEARSWETNMGRLTYAPYADIYQVLQINDEETNYIYDDEHAYTDVQILFMDTPDDPFKHRRYYTCDHFEYTFSK